jgi:microcystin-dependent protein
MATIAIGKIKLVNHGTWDSSTTYTADDIVQHTDNGILSTYVCVVASSLNHTPSTSGTSHASWNFLAKGVAAPDLTTLSASNLTSGTIPDARFPATLPAISGANLTGITSFVSGMILIWSGAANAIPTGWVLCDGTNSTPNLQGRFVVGYHTANGDYDVGDTGGAETVTLTVAQMPAHTHTATTKGTSGSHSWTQFGAGRNDWNYPGENSRGSATTASNGGGTAHENRPPFYALCYIMKS